jgi:hypothetical protein
MASINELSVGWGEGGGAWSPDQNETPLTDLQHVGINRRNAKYADPDRQESRRLLTDPDPDSGQRWEISFFEIPREH